MSKNNKINPENEDREWNDEKSLVEELRKWMAISKIHGFDRLLAPNHILIKLTWIACLLISVVLCALSVIQTVTQYYNYEVTTKIREIYSNSLVFPMVSICNANPMATPGASRYIRDYYRKNFNVSFSTFDEFMQLVKAEKIDNENDFIQYMTYAPDFDPNLRAKFSYQTRFGCSMKNSPCRQFEFELYYDTFYGNCFRFNKDNFWTIESGSQAFSTGILVSPANLISLFDPVSSGILISIDEADYPPLYTHGIAVKPGLMAQISVTKKIVKQMPRPYSNCLPVESIDTILSREMDSLQMKYTRQNCFVLCEQLKVIRELGCYNMKYPRIFNASPCNTYRTYTKLESDSYRISDCESLCPVECETVKYDVSVSYLDFPTYQHYSKVVSENEEFYTYVFNQNVTYALFKSSVAGIMVYFDEVKHIELEESAAMTLTDLVSLIGGTMGLFIGFSVMIIVEFVELVIFSIMTLYNKSFRTRNIENIQKNKNRETMDSETNAKNQEPVSYHNILNNENRHY